MENDENGWNYAFLQGRYNKVNRVTVGAASQAPGEFLIPKALMPTVRRFRRGQL